MKNHPPTIIVNNANRTPEIGDIANAFVDKGAVLEIPFTAADADNVQGSTSVAGAGRAGATGNPLQLTLSGLSRFASFTQNPSSDGSASGVIRFAPGTGDRGDHTITMVAMDNGDSNVQGNTSVAAGTMPGATGTQYQLDATGKVTAIQFTDGAQWLVSDAGIAAVTGDTTQRVDFQRDAQGRIVRMTGPVTDGNGTTQRATAYQFDEQGHLILVRSINRPGMGTPMAYDNEGQPFTGVISANLGAAVNWSTHHQWAGTLQAGETTLAFAVRESELASTVKTPGAQGSVIVAIQTDATDAQLKITGGAILGTTTIGNTTTTLVRVTEAGTKLIHLTAAQQSAATVRITLAGDLNRDGSVNGLDSQSWEQALAANDSTGDLNGDGQITATDRQLLYANYGWRANQAPSVATTLPVVKTHTDLATNASLATIAQDLEGDTVFWRVLDATHGSVRLSQDGQTLLFTPDPGVSGQARITVQADDGFAASSPIELTVNVSSARLLAIHLAPLPQLQPGQTARVLATVDFEDQKGVAITDARYLTVTQADLSDMGRVGANSIIVDDAQDRISATANGPVLIHVTRAGSGVQAMAALNVQAASQPFDPNVSEEDGGYYPPEPIIIEPDVYPGTLTLVPGGIRQLKVHLIGENGEQTAIHTARQTADIVALDAQGQPVTAQSIVGATRYLSSDDTIASVDANGLITAHRAGNVTISVVHLSTPAITEYLPGVDAQGHETYTPIAFQGDSSSIGQSDIRLAVQAAQLTDTDPLTPTPQNVVVPGDIGGAVSTATGETVLIGPGALANDTAVSIHRISIDNLDATTGLPAPAQSILEAVGAFTLNVGEASTDYPLQLAIPVQMGVSVQASDEVLFFRKGTVPDPSGTDKAIWWLVDNGFIGADGIARTASPPYSGVDSSGDYVVMKKLPGVVASSFELMMSPGSWLSFGGLGIGLSGHALAVLTTARMIDIILSSATTVTAGSYHFGIPRFADITLPKVPVGDTYRLNISDVLPPVVTPWGKVSPPNLVQATVNDSGQLTFTIDNPAPGLFVGKIALRMVFGNGTTQDVITLPGDVHGEITLAQPEGIAIGSVRWQVVRLISTDTLSGSGKFIQSAPIEFAGNILSIRPKPDMAAVLTRTGVDFIRQEKTVGKVNLVELLGTPNNLNGDYLSGTKVQPVAFSGDLSRVFVGGNGKVYVIDTLSFKLIDTIDIPAGKNITSLLSVGNQLFIGEGRRFGVGEGHYRLLVMNIDPGSDRYRQVVSLKGTGIESYRYGITGMSASADGNTLVVGVPNLAYTYYTTFKDPGDILVFDLRTLNFDTGVMAPPVKATLPNDGLSGKSPQVITATQDPDRFLVAHESDYDRGLSTLVIARDDNDRLTGAQLSAIHLSQPTNKIWIDRLDIQRAQSAVLVKHGGMEYAIVSDNNFHFNDPYWKAMYEVPIFLYTPTGGLIAVGGSASAKKVAVGGKLGIVQDPFGNARFIAATLPLDGYGITNLSLSDDGRVLIGQLKGSFSANIFDNDQKPHQTHAWDVAALINAALAQPENDRLRKHIKLPEIAAQQIPVSTTSDPVGTTFDPPDVFVSVSGRMGDIIEIDLKTSIARALLKLPSTGSLSEAQKKTVNDLVAQLGNFQFMPYEQDRVSASNSQRAMTLVTQGKHVVTKTGADLKEDGTFYLAPYIHQDDIDDLRSGDTLEQKSTLLVLSYTLKTAVAGITAGPAKVLVNVTANDFDNMPNTFFGDRPLENPGYSNFTLNSTVGLNQGKPLDVWKVEQRLKYLGYSVFGPGTAQQVLDIPTNGKLGVPSEFAVDGKFGKEEVSALKAFNAITQYRYNNGGFTKAADATVATGSANYAWLNAYNAPHWVNVYSALGIPTNQKGGSTSDFVDGTSAKMEIYSTSWTLDLLKAWQVRKPQLVELGLISNNTKLQLNGFSDPTYLFTQHGKGGHSVGMGIDLGVGRYIDPDIQLDINNGNITPAAISGVGTWSLPNALHWTQSPSYLPDVQRNNQQGALRNLLSLYAITQANTTTVNGLWSVLPVVNGQTAALFGSGAQNSQQLIQNVWIGDKAYQKKVNGQWVTVPLNDNPYTAINRILNKLGFVGANGLNHGPQDAHHNHFHVDLRAPVIVPLPKQLTAENTAPAQDAPPSQRLIDHAQAMLDQVNADLNLTEGEVTMFVPDLPNAPPQDVPMMIAQAGQGKADDGTRLRTLGICRPVPNDPADYSENTISPKWAAAAYLRDYERKKVKNIDPGTITLLQAPTHGVVRLVTEADGDRFGEGRFDPSAGLYAYLPKNGYLGNDKAVFLVEIAGVKVKVVYFLQAVGGGLGNYWEELYCSKTGYSWKISSTLDNDGNVTITGVARQTAMLEANGLSGLFSDVSVNFSDLPNGAVGSTQDTTITLDDNAAGHGWYIDYTPYLNEEYLPTSNPYEWQARPGSEADGKMDMLTVLWHEVGHALGLEHTAAGGALMSTTLQPGVRRLPTPDELAMFTAATAGDVVAQSDVPEQAPGMPLAPFAGLPLLFTRQRPTAQATTAEGGNERTAYAVAANATLTNGDFVQANGAGSPAGWQTQGSVLVANGRAVLREVANSQTRLSQVFMVGAESKVLRFTLDGLALDNPSDLPQDAFEVSLIDANTGVSLLGSIGLSRSDALLNMQSNHEEYTAAGVTRVVNSDGSRTYTVDLSDIPAGTAVHLSFDLIGFDAGSANVAGTMPGATGGATSHVTVRDVALIGQTTVSLTARDDVATTAEDTALVIDVRSNDVLSGTTATPVLVTAPTHGALTVNADGTFRYTPNANFNGSDVFSYKLTDGSLQSAVATVAITVTQVNDAPVVSDSQVTTAEDTALAIDLHSYASDVDDAVVTPQIITGPTHGTLTANADGSFRYTSNTNYVGNDSFSYRVNDAGQGSSSVATVNITITPVNDAPIARDSRVVGREDTTYVFTLADFITTDADGDALAAITITTPITGDGLLYRVADGQPLTATIPLSSMLPVTVGMTIRAADIAAGRLRFVPAAHQSGGPSFTAEGVGNLKRHYAAFGYLPSDASGATGNPAAVTIDIDPVADAVTLSGTTAITTVFDARFGAAEVSPAQQLTSWGVWRAEAPNQIEITQRGKVLGGSSTQMLLEVAGTAGGRSVSTDVALPRGKIAALSVQYAAKPGAANSAIDVYWEGAHVGVLDIAAAGLWEFQFTVAARSTTGTSALEFRARSTDGHSGLIARVTVRSEVGCLPGGTVALNLASALTDTDGSEALQLRLTGLPIGARLTEAGSHGRSTTVTAAQPAADISGWHLSGLQLTVPDNVTGHWLTFAFEATSVELNGHRATHTTALQIALNEAALPLDPLSIDLNGDGVQTLALDDSRGRFDLLNTGTPVRSGWLSPDDAFLAIDRNGNGLIDNRTELFGGEPGEAFAQLAGFDSNADGWVDAHDARFHALLLWQDKNSNHQTDAGELSTLTKRGVTALSTAYTIQPEAQHGNLLLERGVATLATGRTAALADAYFQIDTTRPPVRVNEEEETPATDVPVAGDGSASIIVRSQLKPTPPGATDVRWRHWGPTPTPPPASRDDRPLPKIDWTAWSPTARDTPDEKKRPPQDHWLVDFLGVRRTQAPDLAKLTGLKITLGGEGKPKR